MTTTIRPPSPPPTAAQACRRVLWRSKILLLAGLTGGAIACLGYTVAALPTFLALVLWLAFAGLTCFFFRDPSPNVPAGKDLVVAPAHGRVDCTETTMEPEFMGGPCHRISIFLSVFDVHVQNAPLRSKIVYLNHRPGKFLNAMKPKSARVNENILLGLESCEQPGERLAVKPIAGQIARRIVPWVRIGEEVTRGQRLGLIQFGSRCDLFLPLGWNLTVNPGDKVRGGVTVVARRNMKTAPTSATPFPA